MVPLEVSGSWGGGDSLHRWRNSKECNSKDLKINLMGGKNREESSASWTRRVPC